jgi:hypothetical protein
MREDPKDQKITKEEDPGNSFEKVDDSGDDNSADFDFSENLTQEDIIRMIAALDGPGGVEAFVARFGSKSDVLGDLLKNNPDLDISLAERLLSLRDELIERGRSVNKGPAPGRPLKSSH